VTAIRKNVGGSKVSRGQGARGGRPSRCQLLLNAQQSGKRARENWMDRLARDGMMQNWNESELRRQVIMDVDIAVKQGRYKTKKSRSGVISDGVLGGHSSVRRSLQRLMRLRDYLYEKNKDIMKFIFHSKYQALTYMLGKQRNPALRHQVADHKACLAHMKKRHALKAAASKASYQSAVATLARKMKRSPQVQGTFIFTVQHLNKGTQHDTRRPAPRL
jgi:hypothetical protein